MRCKRLPLQKGVRDLQKRLPDMTDSRRLFVERLFQEKGDELRGFLLRRLPSEADAADAFQEVFMRMCRLEDPERIQNKSAFLFRTASNIVRDFYRKRPRSDVPVESLSGDIQLSNEEPSASQVMIGKEWWESYCVAVDELTPKCRKVFVMCRVEKFSHAEIAAELGISTKMVEKYMTKALLHLRTRLAEYFDHDGDD